MAVSLDYSEAHGMEETRVGAICVGPTDRNGVLADLLGNMPAMYGSLVFQKVESADLVDGATDIWRCRVLYGVVKEKEKLKPGQSEFRFSSAKSTVKQTVALASRVFELDPSDSSTAEVYPPDANVIGWKDDAKEAAGTDVVEYLNAFSWKTSVLATTATESWRRQVGNLRGTVNQSSFFGYDAESVLFDDINGTVTGEGVYTFDLSFIQSPNVTNLPIGGLTIPEKKGWEIVDIAEPRWEIVEILGRKRKVPRVSQVKIHRVRPVASWTALGALLGM